MIDLDQLLNEPAGKQFIFTRPGPNSLLVLAKEDRARDSPVHLGQYIKCPFPLLNARCIQWTVTQKILQADNHDPKYQAVDPVDQLTPSIVFLGTP